MSREPLTEDELARLESVSVELKRLFANRPDEGPFAADWDEWLLQLGEFTATNRTAILDALRDTPVADTAGPESERDAITRDRVWASGYSAGRAAASRDTAAEAAAREFVESISFVDTAGIDAAWREAEAALPEGWYLTLGDWAPEAGQTPTTRYEAFAQRYAARDSDDSFMERADSPAAALLALAAALRTPKPEGEPE